MRITKTLWPEFKSYLYLDRKLSDKPASISADKSRFNKLASFFCTKDFNRANFNMFIGMMKEKNYSTSYINNFVKTGKHLDKWLKTNVLVDYTFFKEARKVNYDILTPQEILSLANVKLKYAKNSKYINQRQQVLILLLAETGSRVGEALGLKFEDIYSTPPYVLFKDTKNNDDRRVPIGSELYNLLTTLAKKGENVFVSGRGGKLETQQINIDLKARAKAVGITKPVWCHLLRHSYITTLLEEGVDALDVAVIVGHHDPRSTLRYKNSLIGHYVDIVHMHPLLRKEIPWESRTESLKKFVGKTFDPQNHSIGVTLNKDDITISIKRIGKEAITDVIK